MRGNSGTFAQHEFTRLTAIDIVSQYPVQAEAFLKEVQPSIAGRLSEHPLDRCHDLFFLDTAEHFAYVLPANINESLLVRPASAYLGLGGDDRLLHIFESAHSVMLAVFSAPGNEELLPKHIYPYIESLFKVFPGVLSARQFRMAIKTLVRVTAQPSTAVLADPLLPSTIMECVRSRLEVAPPILLNNNKHGQGVASQPLQVSEQSSYELSLIDSLPMLPIDQLEDWLPVVADSTKYIRDPIQIQLCKDRFWEIFTNGEMDVDRASLCLSWWGTKGGSKMVFGEPVTKQESAMMSGALVENSRL